MKHVFLGKINERVYFLGHYLRNGYGGFKKVELNWDSPNIEEEGTIGFETILKEYETISTSEELLRELDVNESVWIENAEHFVIKKSYGLSGEVVYILKTAKWMDNEESLKEAHNNLEKRKQFLKDQKEKVLDNPAPLHNPIDRRKWYQKVFNV